jgi:hypothetical protein
VDAVVQLFRIKDETLSHHNRKKEGNCGALYFGLAAHIVLPPWSRDSVGIYLKIPDVMSCKSKG